MGSPEWVLTPDHCLVAVISPAGAVSYSSLGSPQERSFCSLHSSTSRMTSQSLLWSSRNDGQSFLGWTVASFLLFSLNARSSVSSQSNHNRAVWSFREAQQTSTGACKQLKVSVTKIRRRYQGSEQCLRRSPRPHSSREAHGATAAPGIQARSGRHTE